MTIANGQTILKSDLDTAFNAHVATLRAENARDCGLLQVNFNFLEVLSTTPPQFRRQTFTVPDDDAELLEFGALVICDTAPKQYKVSLKGPLIEKIELSQEVPSGYVDITRYRSQNRPFQVLLRGATYTVEVESAASSSQSIVRAFVLLRLWPRRR